MVIDVYVNVNHTESVVNRERAGIAIARRFSGNQRSAVMNTQQRPGQNAPEDFPPGLDGGEAPSHTDHRIGETQRQNPKLDRIDPGREPHPRESPDREHDAA